MQLAAKMRWTREPGSYKIGEDKIEITECAWKAHDGQKPDEE